MMRRIIVAFALMIGLLVPMNSTPAQAAGCHPESSSDTVDMGIGIARATTYYIFCNPRRGRNYVIPTSVTGEFWGMPRNCSIWNPFRGMAFNFYLWDAGGRNINPKGFVVSCEGNGNNSEAHTINQDDSKLYYTNGNPPKWKSIVRRRNCCAIPDPEKVASGSLDSN